MTNRKRNADLRPLHEQRRAKRLNGSMQWERRMLEAVTPKPPTPYTVAEIAIMAVSSGVIAGVRLFDGHTSDVIKEGSIHVKDADNIRQAMPEIIKEIRNNAGVEYITIRGNHHALHGFQKRYMLPYMDNIRVYACRMPKYYFNQLAIIADKALDGKTKWTKEGGRD